MVIKINLPDEILSSLVERCRLGNIKIENLVIDLIKLGLFDMEESELYDQPPNGRWN